LLGIHMSETYSQLVEILLDRDDAALEDFLIMESEQDEALAVIGGDQTLMSYLLLFEELMDDHDIYMFDGWEDGIIVGKPKVEKFWVTVSMKVPLKTEMMGAKRMNDALPQSKISAKKVDDGYIVKFEILKKVLDKIETNNKEKIKSLADNALGELG